MFIKIIDIHFFVRFTFPYILNNFSILLNNKKIFPLFLGPEFFILLILLALKLDLCFVYAILNQSKAVTTTLYVTVR